MDRPGGDPFHQVLDDYSRLEPDGADSWTPLASNGELAYRLGFVTALVAALREHPVPVDRLEVLDVGCGTGRSSRALVDLGVRPGHITAMDLRPAAVRTASELNPAIKTTTEMPVDAGVDVEVGRSHRLIESDAALRPDALRR